MSTDEDISPDRRVMKKLDEEMEGDKAEIQGRKVSVRQLPQIIFLFSSLNQNLIILQQLNLMKNLNLLLLFLSLSLAFSTSISLSITISQRRVSAQGSIYELACSDAEGQVIYHAEGLPDGVRLQGNQIIISHSAQSGNFVLRVKAVDALGRTGEQVITLSTEVADAEESILETVGRELSEAVRVQSSASRLKNIITSYSSVESLATRAQTEYEGDQFPLEDFPIGGNDNSVNNGPRTILTKTTAATEEVRNQVTIDDVKLRAASERHQNAVRGITNILKLIDKARGNKRQAELDVEIYTKEYNLAISNQKKAQNFIISVENRIVQIKSAIEGLEDQILKLKDAIEDLVARRDELQIQKAEILEIINGQEREKAKIVDKVNDVSNELAIKVKELAQHLAKCQIIESELDERREELEKLKDLLNEIIWKRKNAENVVEEKKDKVNELRKQLIKAERELSDAETELSAIRAEEMRLPGLISNLEHEIEKLQSRLKRCLEKADDLREEIEDLKNDKTLDLTDEIDKIDDSILEKRRKISIIDSKLASVIADLEDLKAKLRRAEDDIIFLRDQLRVTQEDLRKVYIHGNEANTKVIHAKENIDAAVIRFKQETKILSEATLNLEKVRAEESYARLALEEIISKFSDALPYSVIPNGNGQTNIGNPPGNNAIGSGLGPYFGKKSISSFSSKGDFTSFLSQQFGSGISIRYEGQVEKLYQVKQSSKSSTSLTSQQCAINEEKVVSGEVISSDLTSFDLLAEGGEVFKVEVTICSSIKANFEGHTVQTGDTAIVKGNSISARILEALEIVCLT